MLRRSDHSPSLACSLVFLVCISQSFVVFVSCANPNYSYHVKIQDPIEANYQEKAETRKGDYTEGFYRFVIQYSNILFIFYFINCDNFCVNRQKYDLNLYFT